MARADFHKVIVGRSESMTFVDLEGLEGVPAKTDTGAYRSAVHAKNIKLNKESGVLSFDLLGGHSVCGAMQHHIETKDFTEVWVENSFGHREDRFEVKMKVKLGPKVFTARFSLADRSKKIYPILLGRKLLNNRFLVDPAASSLNRVELKQRYGIEFPKDEEEGRNEDSDSLQR
jgi:hypothetical protein